MKDNGDFILLLAVMVFVSLLVWHSINDTLDWLGKNNCEVVLVDRTLANKEITITVTKLTEGKCEVGEMKRRVLEED